MKILELCHFSSGGGGVWARAREESVRLAEREHEVLVLSSNHVKGENKIAPEFETIKKVKIMRFPAKKLGGESFLYWNFEKQALKFSPDVIITHNYRQLNTTKALKIARILRKQGKKCKVLLVTHAPFVEDNITRSFLQKIIVGFYDKLIGPRTINKFDYILPISHWEIPYLLKLGAKQDKIIYIPNGIPEEFFTNKETKQEHKIIFLGRISPKKKLETLISAIPHIQDKNIKIELIGPKEPEYFNELQTLIIELKVANRITFSEPIYNLNEKIKKLDSAKIFVLPSRVEGMPQSLIEAMSRKKIVIGSNSIAIRDLIKNNQNGFLFEFDNPKDLAEKINFALDKKNKKTVNKIRENALKSVKKFSWRVVIGQIERLIRK